MREVDMRRRMRQFLVASVALLVGGMPLAGWANSTPVITRIELKSASNGDELRLVMAGGAPKDIASFALHGPDRVVVDVMNCTLAKGVALPSPSAGIVRAFRFGRHADKVRVVADVTALADVRYKTEHESNVLILRIASARSAASPGAVAAGKNGAEAEGTGEETQPDAQIAAEGASGGSVWADASSGEDAAEAKVSPLKMSGMVSLRGAVDTREEDSFEEDGYGRGILKVKGEWRYSESVQVVASVKGIGYGYLNDGDTQDDLEARLDDAYLNISNPNFNMKLGNQVVRWGKTDGFSPLDNLNPEDYRDGIAGRREDRKIPIPMANLEVYRDTLTFQGIYIPFFVKSEMDRVGTDWAYFRHSDKEVGAFGVREEDPGHELQNSEYGLRLSGIFRSLNYAASWFSTREDLPMADTLSPPLFPVSDFTPTQLAQWARLSGQTLYLTYDRQNIYGLEMESTWRVFGIRADVAYIDQNSFQTDRLVRVRKPVFRYMAGIDYNSPNAWYANLQFSQSFIQDFDKTIVWADEVTNAVITTFRKDFSNGNYQAECRVYYDFSGAGTLLNPRFIIALWEPFKLELGAEFFDGPEDTMTGYYRNNDQAYGLLEMKF